MRPAAASNNSTTAVDPARFRHWNSPIPYLFGGLALMLGLISLALMILACSFRRPPNSEAEGAACKQLEQQPMDVEPKIVVIMAGDDNPTYLAKPVSCTCKSEQV